MQVKQILKLKGDAGVVTVAPGATLAEAAALLAEIGPSGPRSLEALALTEQCWLKATPSGAHRTAGQLSQIGFQTNH